MTAPRRPLTRGFAWIPSLAACMKELGSPPSGATAAAPLSLALSRGSESASCRATTARDGAGLHDEAMAAARYPGLKAGAPQSPRKARQSRAHVEPSCATDNTVESEGGEGWKSDRDAQLAEGPWRLTDMQLGLAVIRRTPQRRSSTLLLVHLVWSTARRDPRLVADLDAWLHEALRRKAAQSGAEALAIGNASDHVHVV